MLIKLPNSTYGLNGITNANTATPFGFNEDLIWLSNDSGFSHLSSTLRHDITSYFKSVAPHSLTSRTLKQTIKKHSGFFNNSSNSIIQIVRKVTSRYRVYIKLVLYSRVTFLLQRPSHSRGHFRSVYFFETSCHSICS